MTSIFIIPLFLLALLSAPYFIERIKTKNEDKEFNNTYTEALNDISNHNFDSAYNKANQLYANYEENKSLWDKKRLELLNNIERERTNYEASIYKSTGKMLNPPDDSGDLKGEQYKDVKSQFLNTGFIFVSFQSSSEGWFKDEGEVLSVSINGKTSFDDDDEFPEEAIVIITYYVDD